MVDGLSGVSMWIKSIFISAYLTLVSLGLVDAAFRLHAHP